MNVKGKRLKKFRDIARFLKGNGHLLSRPGPGCRDADDHV